MQVDAFEVIRVGQVVHIENTKKRSRRYGVFNILSRELVVCQALDKQPSSMNFNPSDEVTVVVPGESGGAYLIRATVNEVDKSARRVIIKPVSEIDHTQRRGSFRISKPTALVKYQLMGQDSNWGIQTEGIVWDLSGGGIGVIIKTTKTIHPGSLIKLTIALPNEEPIEAVGKIVRVTPKNIIRNEYQLGICFTEIDEKDKSIIVRCVAQEELARKYMNKYSDSNCLNAK